MSEVLRDELADETAAEALRESAEEETFVVDSDAKAEWCMQQIRRAEEGRKRWKTFYDEQYRKVSDACDFTVAYMEDRLRRYFGTVPHKSSKTQENYTLPSGKLVLKRHPPEFQRDDAVMIPWLKENGGSAFVKTTEILDWAALKKGLTVLGDTVTDADGVVIPGIQVTPRPEVFKVELKGKEGSV